MELYTQKIQDTPSKPPQSYFQIEAHEWDIEQEIRLGHC